MVTAESWTEGREIFNYPNYAKTRNAGNLITFYFKALGLVLIDLH